MHRPFVHGGFLEVFDAHASSTYFQNNHECTVRMNWHDCKTRACKVAILSCSCPSRVQERERASQCQTYLHTHALQHTKH